MATVVKIRNPKATGVAPSGVKGGYYVGKEDNTQIYFREGLRKSKKDPLVATAVDEDSALVLVEQANIFWRCQCGEAEALANEALGEEDGE